MHAQVQFRVARRRTTVLVVEDEVMVRLMLADALRTQGYAVLEAAGPREAVLILRTGTPVDVVVTDLHMPDADDGPNLVRFVGRHHPDIRLVIASGHPPPQDIKPLITAAFVKPYDLDALLASIRAAVPLEADPVAAKGAA